MRGGWGSDFTNILPVKQGFNSKKLSNPKQGNKLVDGLIMVANIAPDLEIT